MKDRYCCDGLCQQGRRCPENMPAEACTELGCDDESVGGSDDLILAILIIVAVLCVLGVLWKYVL